MQKKDKIKITDRRIDYLTHWSCCNRGIRPHSRL